MKKMSKRVAIIMVAGSVLTGGSVFASEGVQKGSFGVKQTPNQATSKVSLSTEKSLTILYKDQLDKLSSEQVDAYVTALHYAQSADAYVAEKMKNRKPLTKKDVEVVQSALKQVNETKIGHGATHTGDVYGQVTILSIQTKAQKGHTYVQDIFVIMEQHVIRASVSPAKSKTVIFERERSFEPVPIESIKEDDLRYIQPIEWKTIR